ncbi:ElaB/YqjD/DUF883 family membrane-anchored ribosome-binding protein [Sphingomonas naasensis]|uniref:hypothetical protein n=1 Tax=Sphingomonas naasensis TaxID=1344951 RepID=UPI0019D09E04|nr:hypothetical protein [Sphingomonas naasensis]NIJ18530.1 ElaB/YqjD/DUF883 family membrane-anchored ribosome-binding protein [Sphingomonas naasensis]
MADAKNSKTPGGEQVDFKADPGLEATASGTGPAAINFEASEDVGGARSGATQQLRDEASKLKDQAAERARAFAGEGKDRATSALDEVARLMQSAAGDVDAKLGEEYGRYARSAADGIAGWAESLRGKEVDDLIEDASALVRKSPAIAVGTAAAVGFVLARLIKSGIDAASESSGRKSPETSDA